MEESTSSISVSISKDGVDEEMSMFQASMEDASGRLADGMRPEAISNERIQNGDEMLGTYQVTSGAILGGMGSVWRVHHKNWDVDLAMKRPQPKFFAEGSERRKEEFIHECENWIDLGLHPNIVSCYYVREIGGVPSIFSEWMENGSLKDRIRDGSLYEGTEREVQERILDIAIQILRGLQYSHEKGLIHQDVKPGNILLTKIWDAKVADFGLANARAQLIDGKNSASSGYTIQYCPKEQAEGMPAQKWMDVYAWALTVLELYAGRRLWDTGAQAKGAFQKYLSQSKHIIPETVLSILKTCLTEKKDSIDTLEEELTDAYRTVTGEVYPRPEPKEAENVALSLNNKALSYLDLGNAKKAVKLWNEAIKQNATHPESLYNYALFRWRSADTDDVEAVNLLNACRQSPEYERLISKLELERGNPEGVKSAADDSDREYASMLPRPNLQKIGTNQSYDSFQVSPDGHKLLALLPAMGKSIAFDIYAFPEGKLYRSFRTKYDKGKNCSGLALDWNDHRFSFLEEKKEGDRLVCRVTVYDLVSLKLLHQFPVDPGCGAPCLFSPDGKRIYTDAGTVLDPQNGAVLGKIPYDDPRYTIKNMAISHDGKTLAVSRNAPGGKIDRNYDYLCLYDTHTLTSLKRLNGRGQTTNDIKAAFSSDSSQLYINGNDGHISIWNTESDRESILWKKHGIGRKTPGDIALSTDDSLLAACFMEDLKLIDTASGRCLRTIPLGGKPGESDQTAFFGDRICFRKGRNISVFSVPDFSYRANWALSKIEAVGQRLEKDSRFLSLLDAAQKALQHKQYTEAMRSLEEARLIDGMYNDPRALKLNREIGMFSRRASLESVDLAREDVFPIGQCQKIVFSKDGGRVLCVCFDRAYLIETSSGKRIRSYSAFNDTDGKYPGFIGAAMNAEGTLICLTGGYLYDAATGRMAGKLEGHDSRICCAQFSPDGSLIATVSEHGRMLIHRSGDLSCVCRFDHGDGYNYGICFFSDGDRLLVNAFKSMLQIVSISQCSVLRSYPKGIGLKPELAHFGYRDFEISHDEKKALVHGTGYFTLDLETGEIVSEDLKKQYNHAVYTGFQDQLMCMTGENTLVITSSLNETPEFKIVNDFRRAAVLAVSPNMDYAAVGPGFNNTMYLYELNWKYRDEPHPQAEKKAASEMSDRDAEDAGKRKGFLSKLFGKK